MGGGRYWDKKTRGIVSFWRGLFNRWNYQSKGVEVKPELVEICEDWRDYSDQNSSKRRRFDTLRTREDRDTLHYNRQVSLQTGFSTKQKRDRVSSVRTRWTKGNRLFGKL